ncbi:hypothetical protein COC45_02820 [Bacillus cereus]|nr:hypothetical protein COJ40_21825 [Bacillus cereus]PGS16132.1 hypothetical protein COC45_02820 [Bacillus cereus]
MMVHEIISTIFQIYRSQLAIYQRFFHYIDHNSQYINDSTKNINLPTNNDNNSTHLLYFHQYITISFMLKYRKHLLVIRSKKLFQIHHLLIKWREWFS